MTVPDTGWMDQAACNGHTDLGWMKGPEDTSLAEERAMAGHCARCPVRADCLIFAERLEVTAGFWAGHFWTPDGPLLPLVPVSGDAA
jgi:hypothetical protein